MGIDALAQLANIEHTVKRGDVSRLLIRLDSTPVHEEDCCNIMLDKNVIQTNGQYAITYDFRYKGLRYALAGDIFGESKWRVRVANWKELQKLAEKDKRVKWVIENTTLTEEHFETAKENKLMRIPFCVDIVKYNKRLKTREYRDKFQKGLTNLVLSKKED